MVEQSRETPAAHRSGEPVATKLLRIEAKARQERKLKFINLYYLMNEELLLRCFRQMSENKAVGIDKVTKEQYADIGKAISTRLGRLQAKSLKGFNMRQVNADSLVDVTYGATFEKANGTIVARLKIQNGEWKLVSFRVTSPEFQKDVATAKCAKCGAPHARDARFCPACGNAIPHDKTISEPLVDEATGK
jgi:hypothetical protein